MSYLQLLRLASPEAVVVAAALGVLAIGLTSGQPVAVSSLLACAGLVVAVGAVLMLPANAIFSGGMLLISPQTSLFKVVCLTLAFFTVVLAGGDSRSLRNYSEFLALIFLSTVGLMLLVGSDELLVIFIGLELTGLSLYVLTAFDRTNVQSAEAGLKYFLFGSTASAFTLFGLSFIYGMSGSTGLDAIAQSVAAQPMPPLLAAGMIMTLVGFAFKVAAAPFHLWAPDTYQVAPVSSAAFIASGSKVASFVVLGKILLIGLAPLRGSADWHGFIAGWAPVVALFAALSIVIGNLVALAQANVRRLLAYSAVAHAGYTLLGIIAGGKEGFTATLFYSTAYAFTLLGAFSVVGIIRRDCGADDLKSFSGLWSRAPLVAGCMAIFILSLAGLPPLAGFFGKFYLFSATFRSGSNHGLLWLVGVALFGSLISLYYYLTILKAIFVDEGSAHHPPVRVDSLQRVSLTLLALAVVGLGICPESLVARIAASLP